MEPLGRFYPIDYWSATFYATTAALRVQHFPANAAGRNAIDSQSSLFIITIFIARIPVFFFIVVILEERN